MSVDQPERRLIIIVEVRVWRRNLKLGFIGEATTSLQLLWNKEIAATSEARMTAQPLHDLLGSILDIWNR